AGDGLCKEIARAADARVTLIRPDGVVVGDSEEKSTNMENHSGRPEVKAAMDQRIAPDVRSSYTLGIPFVYVAVPLIEQGRTTGIVRLARPVKTVNSIFSPVRGRVWQLVLLVAVLGLVAMWFNARWLARPIDTIAVESAAYARGEFGRRVVFPQPTPLDPLADALNGMARSLG